MQTVKFIDLGSMDYKLAWDYQEALFSEVVASKVSNRNLPNNEQQITNNYLLFCEHPHVYTLGNTGDKEHLLISEKQLAEKNATYYKINRGGDITYHGPGQIVGYPILDLDNFFTDIHKYLRFLEEMVILTLAEYGVEAGRSPGKTGVWIDADNPLKARKICAMGVRASRWVTMHGFALNVNVDLDYFGNIIPCGIADKAVTSLDKELGRFVDEEDVKQKLKKHFADLFVCKLVDAKI
ncbi:MAG: lipoyl(octanoyl) transferase LipB [Bacteroidia bacterium]